LTRTAFVGLSHLGINYGIAWASFGQPVVGFDLVRASVAQLQAGHLPVHEPGLPELFARSREMLTFVDDPAALANCDLVVVARDVPTDAANASDVSPVLELVDAVAPHLRDGVTLAVMSQLPTGFTRHLRARLVEDRPDLDFSLYYWVETLVFGDAVRRALHPERLIVGCADPTAPLAATLAEGLARFECPIFRMSYESAELTKMAINLYLIGSVTYANTLADLCESVGADWSQMVPALKADARIGPAAYIRPGLGVAGGNLERDLTTLRALARTHDLDTTYLDALSEHHAHRLDWAHRKLAERVFSQATQPIIGVWGLTYKKNTHSTKNSPSLRIIADLQARARLRAWDPVIRAGEVATGAAEVVDDGRAVLDGADCLLIMADWDEFAAADLQAIRQRMRRPLVIDCVGVLDARRGEMDLDGIEYVSMGHSASPSGRGRPEAG
jgi:UDPglucose 6-dehydrogenase